MKHCVQIILTAFKFYLTQENKSSELRLNVFKRDLQ